MTNQKYGVWCILNSNKFDSSLSSYDIFLHLPFISLPILCSTFRSFLLMRGQNISDAEVMFCHLIYLWLQSLTFSLEDELQNTCRAGHASETNLKVPEGLFWCHQLLPAFHYVFVALHFHNSQRHQQIRFKLTCICLNRYFLSQFTCDKLNEIIRTTCICIPISFQKLPVYVHKKLGSRLLRCQNIWTIYDLPHH